jgi:hypothetical protein
MIQNLGPAEAELRQKKKRATPKARIKTAWTSSSLAHHPSRHQA